MQHPPSNGTAELQVSEINESSDTAAAVAFVSDIVGVQKFRLAESVFFHVANPFKLVHRREQLRGVE